MKPKFLQRHSRLSQNTTPLLVPSTPITLVLLKYVCHISISSPSTCSAWNIYAPDTSQLGFTQMSPASTPHPIFYLLPCILLICVMYCPLCIYTFCKMIYSSSHQEGESFLPLLEHGLANDLLWPRECRGSSTDSVSRLRSRGIMHLCSLFCFSSLPLL